MNPGQDFGVCGVQQYDLSLNGQKIHNSVVVRMNGQTNYQPQNLHSRSQFWGIFGKIIYQ